MPLPPHEVGRVPWRAGSQRTAHSVHRARVAACNWDTKHPVDQQLRLVVLLLMGVVAGDGAM